MQGWENKASALKTALIHGEHQGGIMFISVRKEGGSQPNLLTPSEDQIEGLGPITSVIEHKYSLEKSPVHHRTTWRQIKQPCMFTLTLTVI